MFSVFQALKLSKQVIDEGWCVCVYQIFLEISLRCVFFLLSSFSCELSSLELRDGADSNAPVIVKLCGNSLPSTQRSSGAVLYMRFRSDGTDARAGFKAKYLRGI